MDITMTIQMDFFRMDTRPDSGPGHPSSDVDERGSSSVKGP